MRPILHVKLFNPVNDHYGLSPIEAAATALDIHNTASKWNKALLDNSARPSGALVYTARDGNLSPDQFDRLKTELEQGFQGAAHAGRPLLLEGGLDWKSMSLTPKDMDFIEGAFLDELTGHPHPANLPPRPMPDSNHDICMLDRDRALPMEPSGATCARRSTRWQHANSRPVRAALRTPRSRPHSGVSAHPW